MPSSGPPGNVVPERARSGGRQARTQDPWRSSAARGSEDAAWRSSGPAISGAMFSGGSLNPSDEDAGITGPGWIKAHLDPAHQLELSALPRAPGIEAVADPRRSVEHHNRRLRAELVTQRSQRLGLDLDPAQ